MHIVFYDSALVLTKYVFRAIEKHFVANGGIHSIIGVAIFLAQ